MYRAFKFLLLFLAIQQYRSVDCYMHRGLIWSRTRQKFIPISHASTLGTCDQEIMTKSRESENHNFQGEVLKLAYVEDHNMVNFIDNDTKVTGVCGEIWNTLAEYSNFTLITIKTGALTLTVDNSELSAVMLTSLNETQIVPRMAFSWSHSDVLDFTTPIWQTRYRMYIQPEWQNDTDWIFNIFDYKVCFAISLFVLVLSVLGYLIQNIYIKVFHDKKCIHNLHDHLFYTFALVCSQGFIPDALERGSKIFCVCKRTFVWLLLIVLSSNIISYLTNIKIQLPFEDIESLLNTTDLGIMIYRNSIAGDQFWRAMRDVDVDGFAAVRTTGEDSQENMHKNACEDIYRSWVIFELEDTMQAFGNHFCEMVAIGKSYFPIWVSSGISKGFKYKRTFDIGILKMKEFGLIDRLKNRWLKSTDQTIHSQDPDQVQKMPVNLNQVLMLFIILCTGIVASAIICVLEIIVFVYKSNQR